jgi:PAS domain-containing protein
MDELDLQNTRAADLATGEHALLARILQELPAAIFVLDRHGVIRRANPRSATELGLPPGNLPGKPLAALLDLRWRPAMRSALSSVLRDGTTRPIDVRLGMPSQAELSRLTLWPVTGLSRPESLIAVHALTPSALTGTDHSRSAGTP